MNTTGNHLCGGDDKDPKPNPDDYGICLRCGKANHVDDLDHGTCRTCFEVQEHEYYCKSCETEFKYFGIPATCPGGHFDIDFDTRTVDGWLEEVQEAYIKKLDAAPMQTPSALLNFIAP